MSSVGGSHSSREDVCVCGRRRIVDAQQSTPAQHREDWGAVVCDEPSATSDPTGSHTRQQRFCPDCRLGKQHGHLPGFRGFHEDSCFQNSVQLIQCTASAAVYSAIRHVSMQSYSRSSCHWCSRDSTTATRPLLVYLVASWTDSSQSWMLLHDLSSRRASTIM